jgi:hypothetical protein
LGIKSTPEISLGKPLFPSGCICGAKRVCTHTQSQPPVVFVVVVVVVVLESDANPCSLASVVTHPCKYV